MSDMNAWLLGFVALMLLCALGVGGGVYAALVLPVGWAIAGFIGGIVCGGILACGIYLITHITVQ